MDKAIFGDNQFFGVDHLSEERSRAKMMRFKDPQSIIKVLDAVYDSDINTFMCTTYDRMWDICDHFRANPDRYNNFKFYPCMPYAHKYANAVTELGILGTIKKYAGGNITSSIAKGSKMLIKQDMNEAMKLLIDSEMKMFHSLNTPVIFLQNVVTDLLYGLGMTQFFKEFSDYVAKRYNAEAGFITMNMPALVPVLQDLGIDNPIVCTSINKVGFRMAGGKAAYEATLQKGGSRTIAMQVLAAGAIRPDEAIKYIGSLPNIESVLFGASTPAHINQTRALIEQYLS